MDMSEYMESHTVARLFGSPPGYVGYDEGGQLTERVRRRPYSVVLFDEIEKAHPEVFNALLQIMDDGRLTDGKGRSVDFKNTVVIMTSNVATEDIKRNSIGFATPRWGEAESQADSEEAKRRAKALEGLRRAFRPEFLNRIDQVVVFNSLEREQLSQIVDLLMAKVSARLAEQGMTLRYGDDLRGFLMREGFDAEFGARPLRRAIQTNVDDALADAILAGELKPGQMAVLSVTGDAVTVTAEGEPLPALQPAPVNPIAA